MAIPMRWFTHPLEFLGRRDDLRADPLSFLSRVHHHELCVRLQKGVSFSRGKEYYIQSVLQVACSVASRFASPGSAFVGPFVKRRLLTQVVEFLELAAESEAPPLRVALVSSAIFRADAVDHLPVIATLRDIDSTNLKLDAKTGTILRTDSSAIC